jgi:hypothetical protein
LDTIEDRHPFDKCINRPVATNTDQPPTGTPNQQWRTSMTAPSVDWLTIQAMAFTTNRVDGPQPGNTGYDAHQPIIIDDDNNNNNNNNSNEPTPRHSLSHDSG